MADEESGFAPEPGPGLFPELEPDQAAPQGDLPWPPWLENLGTIGRVRAIVGAVATCSASGHTHATGVGEQHVTTTMAVRFLLKLIAGEDDPPQTLAEASEAMLPPPSALLAPGGRFEDIAFFGHLDHTGYVTEAIDHGGNAVYRIDLPEKIWGGNPLAEIEYAASAKFSRKPVTEESVRAQWEAERARAERWRQQQAEWDRAGSQRALPAVDMSESLTGEAADPDWKPCLCGPDEECDECEPGGRPF